jgi:tripartite-type tricarboxylate transporter receptor subunit TctC
LLTLLWVALAAALLPATAAAQAFPHKTITIVVPFPPGGSTDLLARRIAEKLSASLGQTVVVDNRAGAGGTVGADHVAKSSPDGYTLLMGVTGSNAIAGALYPSLPYDPVKSFSPVTIVAVAPLVLAVNPDSPAKTVQEFVALAKKKPGQLTHGSPGNGTSMHLTGVMFEHATGTKLLHVPYRGSAAALRDLLGGRIDAMFGDVAVLMPMVQSNKVMALAVTSKNRHPLMPNVPTVAESGYPDFEALSWQGLFAPANTPRPIVARLSQEVNKALQSPDIQKFFSARGFLVGGDTPDEFSAFVAEQTKKWAKIVKSSGIKLN